MPGILYLVSTPIGNMEDITLRALRILREVEAIACEDTRQTQKLLAHYDIRHSMISYHEHNEKSRTPELIELLQNGKSVALVSDAGTPLLSDPGYRLVTETVKQGFPVVPVPGASAALAALSASGLPTGAFLFAGFLPPKKNARRSRLEELSEVDATLVLYESPHRILETLADIYAVLGARPVVLARELTKLHEETLRGTGRQILEELASRASIKGEMTLVIGPPEEQPVEGDPAQEVAALQAQGTGRMEAIKLVARRMQLPKRVVYRLAAERGSNPPDKHRDSDRTDR